MNRIEILKMIGAMSVEEFGAFEKALTEKLAEDGINLPE